MAKVQAKIAKKADLKQKSSNVIKTGTGSGIHPKAGSTKTPMSHPIDQNGLGRKPASALK